MLVSGLIMAAAAVAVLTLPPLRRPVLSRALLAVFRRALPRMSATEREALEAGSVWWEGELFSGRPRWQRLAALPVPRLNVVEQRFLDEQVEEACRLCDDWQVTQTLHDLPPSLWRYLREQGFFGLIIPERFGGLGFSALAHSTVIAKLSTRCSALAVSVMVPNSLGPAELLLRYGTDSQQRYYLPRLARGEEIPAFALTSPWAGSDAAAIPDAGIVCRGYWDGHETLGMRVSWDKRYITLAPVCTLLGLAFRLYDPEHLLGDVEDLGITCALVPRDHPGVEIGHRHRPLDAMFMNGPTRGHDVFMPLEFIIGGPAMAGQGWRMLMECLAAGRSISLPSSYTGMSWLTARAVGGYARVRQQFRAPIARFEGVAEALARIAGHTYVIDAARRLTAGALDLGEKPAVVSAIVKLHITERARQVVNDGMDVIGGKGICLGPANFLGRAYQQVPIGITVEGANILTRSLVLFGQGAIRCHPWLLTEMRAAQDADRARGLRTFDQALFAHLRHIAGNGLRALGHGLSGARLARVDADVDAAARGHYRQLTRVAAAFAFSADVALLLLGGSLKRRELLSARLGDVLAQLYLASATLKRFEDDGRPAADRPLLDWGVQDALYRAQQALDGLIDNFPYRPVRWLLRGLLFPLGRAYRPPHDRLLRALAQALSEPSPTRERLCGAGFVPRDEREPLAAIEAALVATLAAEPAEVKVRAAEKAGRFAGDPRANVRDLYRLAFEYGVVDAEEYALLERRDRLRDCVVHVDEFPFDLSAARAAPGPCADTA